MFEWSTTVDKRQQTPEGCGYHASTEGVDRCHPPGSQSGVLPMPQETFDPCARCSGTASTPTAAESSATAAADCIGVRILIVHALRESAAALYRALGFRPSPTDPLHLYLLLSDARASLEE